MAGGRHRAPGLLTELARVVVPLACPGCHLPDVVLCSRCAARFAGPPRRCETAAPRLDRMAGIAPLPVWALTSYDGPVPGVVVGWKDKGRADVGPALEAAMTRAGRRLAPVLAEAAGDLRVVGVPTTAAARRRRGADLVAGLTAAVARGVAAGGVGAEPVRALRRWTGRDQVGRSARDRARVELALARTQQPAGRWYLLVDDVLTTGATLAAAERTLTRAGGLVVGAVVLAATPRPGR